MTTTDFGHGTAGDLLSTERLKELALMALDAASAKGATQAAVRTSCVEERNVELRNSDIDRLSQQTSHSFNISVFFGKKLGSISTTTLEPEAIKRAVGQACTLAKFSDNDPCQGLPEIELLASDITTLELDDEQCVSVDLALTLTKQVEASTNHLDPTYCKSDTCGLSASRSNFILANSLGFCAGYPSSAYSLWSQAIAQRKGTRQLSDWSATDRFLANVQDKAQEIGRRSATRALAALDARKLATQRCSVLFEAPTAISLMSQLTAALSGSALYLNKSFLGACRGAPVLPSHFNILEDPFVTRGLASARFDHEGVRGTKRLVVEQGVVQDYFLGTYSARRLGLKSTGNAGGPYNLVISSERTTVGDDLKALIRKLDRGLLVTSLLGSGLNPVTGDYSQGVSGFWIEGGEIQYPVAEITIAANISDVFQRCVSVGNDVLTRRNISCGSLLIDDLQVAGS